MDCAAEGNESQFSKVVVRTPHARQHIWGKVKHYEKELAEEIKTDTTETDRHNQTK